MKASRRLILAAVAQVVWSTLDDTCQYVPLTEPHVPTPTGSYQVPHGVEWRPSSCVPATGTGVRKIRQRR
jgi:hypothetical protein